MRAREEFQGCRDRIGRAKSHSQAFAEAWNGFLDEQPYDASVTMEEDGTGTIWVSQVLPLPDSLSFELGEFLYQVRAALDGLVYAAAIAESGQNPPPDADRLEFPICESPEKFEGASWKIRPLTKERRDIIESVQPYKTPDLPPELYVLSVHRTLGILNDWARKDRHRRLHVVGSWASTLNPMVEVPPSCELEYILVTYDGLIDPHKEIARFRLSGYQRGVQVRANPKLAIDVAVAEPPEPCADNDTLNMRMRAMTAWTGGLIDAVEKSLTQDSG